jgi:phosphatidylserine decarboxylase
MVVRGAFGHVTMMLVGPLSARSAVRSCSPDRVERCVTTSTKYGTCTFFRA